VPPTRWILRLALAAALGIGTGLLVPLPQLAAAVVGTLVFVATVLGLRLAPPELADSLTPRRWMSG
jgi:hypothetical protein